MPQYWYSRWLFERALAAIYVVAFIAAARQFVPLLGTHGLEPVGPWLRAVPFRASPACSTCGTPTPRFAWPRGSVSSSRWRHSRRCRSETAQPPPQWFGARCGCLYLSFVNIGQTFYGFGWETLLCEVGFFAIFAGPSYSTPNIWLVWVWRWTLFRLMFGAGLIKLRGDSCWRDFTCLEYYFETQPMPNALSWYFHWMPHSVHAAGVAINHAVEVAVPFAYFLPQPFASIAGIVTIVFQLALIVSGNLSWLNWLTVVLCIPLISDSWLHWLPVHMPADLSTVPAFETTMYVVAAVVALLSIGPVMNLMSNRQMMNASFEPLHLVNTYGAFGSVTRERYESFSKARMTPSSMPAPCGKNTSSRGSQARWTASRRRWRPIICASTG